MKEISVKIFNEKTRGSHLSWFPHVKRRATDALIKRMS